jgi:FAD/FMN-containing dehydrogenase
MRWKTELRLSRTLHGKLFSRNQLINESAEVYREQNADRTDILHEYFVPPDRFAAFLERMRKLLPRPPLELMNVTIRDVREDRDTFLPYADRDVLSLVMHFDVPLTREADADMEKLTRELIDAVLACGGRYYLPYRLHATREQFEKAYPQARQFFEKKRQYDPDEVFQNRFYVRYGSGS